MREAPQFICRVSNRYRVNSFTETITFMTDRSISGLKLYHSDLTMLGKHYLVEKVTKPSVKRNYTISNCMKKEVYDEYLMLLSSDQSQEFSN